MIASGVAYILTWREVLSWAVRVGKEKLLQGACDRNINLILSAQGVNTTGLTLHPSLFRLLLCVDLRWKKRELALTPSLVGHSPALLNLMRWLQAEWPAIHNWQEAPGLFSHCVWWVQAGVVSFSPQCWDCQAKDQGRWWGIQGRRALKHTKYHQDCEACSSRDAPSERLGLLSITQPARNKRWLSSGLQVSVTGPRRSSRYQLEVGN